MEYSLQGVIRPMPDGSFEVDLRGSIDGVPVATKRAKATSTAAALSEDDVQSEIDAARERIGQQLATLAEDMTDLLATENKSGKVALSKVLRQIYRPLVSATEKGLSGAALVHGMELAVAKGIPNVNYAKRAAESYNQPAVIRPSGANTASRYDIIGDGE